MTNRHPVRRLSAVRPARARGLLALSTALIATVPAATSAGAAGTGNGPLASSARSLNVTDEAHLRYHESSGSSLIEEGTATGGLPGAVKVHFTVGPTVSATFTITTHSGSLIGHGSGVLHSSGTYASFRGSMSITRGTGHYVHAHGSGGFYGVLNRKTYALTVQTTGRLSY